MFPNGNIMIKIQSSADIGNAVRSVRKALGLTQDQLALTSGTNRRFVIEVEAGKATTQTGKVLKVLQTLGINVTFGAPPGVTLNDAPTPTRDDRD